MFKMEDKDQFIMHIPYHDSWCYGGGVKSQGLRYWGRYPDYSGLGTKAVQS